MVFRSLVTGVTVSAAGLATPMIIQDLKIDIRTILNISATVGFFLTFVAIAVGWWADRHPRVPLLAWGGAISGLFSMLSGRATNAATLGPPWVVGGVASEMADVPTFSLTADYYPPEARGKVFTIFNLVGKTAALPMGLAGALLLDWIGWRKVYVIGGAIGIAASLALLKLLKEPVRGYMERRAMGADEAGGKPGREDPFFREGWREVLGGGTHPRPLLAPGISAPPVTL